MCLAAKNTENYAHVCCCAAVGVLGRIAGWVASAPVKPARSLVERSGPCPPLSSSDPVAYQEYAARSPAVVAAFSGRHIARGGRVMTFEGPEETRRIVIAEFPDFATAEACYRSPEYQALAQHRFRASRANVALLQGLA